MKYICTLEERASKRQDPNPLVLSAARPDGWGMRAKIRYREGKGEIGRLVYRLKDYLAEEGYPQVAELHLSFKSAYQGKGLFQWAVLALAQRVGVPIWIARHRVTNPHVERAIGALDPELLEVTRLEWGWLIRPVDR